MLNVAIKCVVSNMDSSINTVIYLPLEGGMYTPMQYCKQTDSTTSSMFIS
jgi:hypothetical protein